MQIPAVRAGRLFEELRAGTQHRMHVRRYEPQAQPLPEGDFTALGARTDGETVRLTVQMERAEPLYLRGFVGQEYTAGGWEALPRTLAGQSRLLYWLHKRLLSADADRHGGVRAGGCGAGDGACHGLQHGGVHALSLCAVYGGRGEFFRNADGGAVGGGDGAAEKCVCCELPHPVRRAGKDGAVGRAPASAADAGGGSVSDAGIRLQTVCGGIRPRAFGRNAPHAFAVPPRSPPVIRTAR